MPPPEAFEHAVDVKPRERGLSMPAEWAPHAGCWMGWPKRESIWNGHMEGARDDYAKVARAISRFEPVTLLADPADAADAARRCGPTVRVVTASMDDSWLRDSGPTFVVDSAGRRGAAAFTFNAWGGRCSPYDRDATLAAQVADLTDTPLYRSWLVCEGGGFLSDGEGTLITAETCVLNPNRNPGLTKAQATRELEAMLGVDKVIWLPGDPTDQATDGHVDGYVAFFKPGAVLIETVADPSDPRHALMAENRRVLETERDARGRHFDLVEIAEAPRGATPPGESVFCRSYVNFYLANGAVVAPAYGIREDRQVSEVLRRAYPSREVVMLELQDLFRGGGGIHCITQQEPLGQA